MRTIEICMNAEWMDLAEDPYQDDAARDWFGLVVREIDDRFGFGTAQHPENQRIFYHGWNGARFKREGFGLGTFDDFTDAEWGEAETIAAQARETVEEKYQALKP